VVSSTSASPAASVALAWSILESVLDPEVPALSVVDLGLVRAIHWQGETLEIALTPTYSGCPATEVIERDVLDAVRRAGFAHARVRLQRAPAWSSDWISAAGRRKLREYGIAPPGPVVSGAAVPIRPRSKCALSARPEAAVACPRCASLDTEVLSEFGATACKSLYRCRACREPFEYFKSI
jgi:ring-1,2-phenylacetyl-CoA epoxidase subunit PaaD